MAWSLPRAGFDMTFSDENATVSQLKEILNDFVAERNWERFHLPKNLAMSIAIETAELMEHFQWTNPPASLEAVGDDSPVAQELADVLAYTLRLAEVLGVDLSHALELKMERNKAKYPVGVAFVPKGIA
jgi:NTP pyrophosphatase (non-canonical NTP hydrolase)